MLPFMHTTFTHNEVWSVICAVRLLLHLVARGGVRRLWWYMVWDQRMDVVVTTITVVTTIAARYCVGGCDVSGYTAWIWKEHWLLMPQSLQRWSMLRLLLVICHSITLQNFTHCFFSIVPALVQTIGFYFVVMYFFAVVSVELMGSHVAEFSTFGSAVETLVQVCCCCC